MKRCHHLNYPIIALLFFGNLALTAQKFSRLNIKFIVNNIQLKNPLTGGLNAPQFSAVDLNNDGRQDLYVFDRVGNVHLTFLNDGNPGETRYTFAPQFIENFPPSFNFVLLRDYNMDGIPDIFSHSDDEGIPGIKVYKGKYVDEKIAFDRLQFTEFQFNVLSLELPNGTRTNLPVNRPDYPSVDDVDSDGDLDIIAPSITGSFMVFFKNLALEKGFTTDTLIFEMKDGCWGNFFITPFAAELTLSGAIDSCAFNFSGGQQIEDRNNPHGGSTVLTWDLDNDGVREISMGDLIFPKIITAFNGGTSEVAWMIDQDIAFPSYDEAVNIPQFPGCFYLDLDNDGLKDFVAAPNNINSTPDKEVVWFYKNIQSNEEPLFELQQKDLLVKEMLDFGSGANPAFVDYNADGLLDFVVGNFSFFQEEPPGTRDPHLFLFKNIGTAEEPKFELIDDDWLGFHQFFQNSWAFAPTFGDLDNDGDLDLLVGERFGNLFYAENTAGPGNPLSFGSIQFGWKDINVGQYSTPQIADVNRDGLPDLVIGERNGNIDFFPNQGTPSEPDFQSEPAQSPNNPEFGKIDAAVPGFPSGYSAPLLFDFGDKFWILTGTQLGWLEAYEVNPDSLDEGAFPLLTDRFGDLLEGTRTKPALADLNNDGILDLLVGNFRGGLGIFQTNVSTGGLVPTREVVLSSLFQIYPNPAANLLMIHAKNEDFKMAKFVIYDTKGHIVSHGELLKSTTPVSLTGWNTGIYFLELRIGGKKAIRKFIKE